MLKRLVLVSSLLSAVSGAASAEDPKPVPSTRPEMKGALERLKQRKPRLPAPPVPASADDQPGRIVVQNGMFRRYYLPQAWYAADFAPDPSYLIDRTFKVSLFWIVSRLNNCQYCLGHQEHVLHSAGWDDDAVAALDGDWSEADDRARIARRLAREITIRPHRLAGFDWAEFRKQFPDREAIEILYTLSFYNSVNRWTDGLGLPQDQRFRTDEIHLDTPTSARFSERPTSVAGADDFQRPALESWETVRSEIEKARTREPRVPWSMLDGVAKEGKDWERVLSLFPSTGAKQIAALKSIETEGHLPADLKAELAWISARLNRSWTALALAEERMLKSGRTSEQIREFDARLGGPDALSPAHRLASRLTANPRQITDGDIEAVRQEFTDHQTAEIVYVICAANFFDRFNESLQLRP